MSASGAVLFDIDGTLVDSNYLHVTAWLEAFQSVGRLVPAASIHRCIGMDGGRLLETLLGDRAEELGAQAKGAHDRRYMDAKPSLRAFEDAPELVRAVAARGAAVLATSAPDDELAVLREILQVDDAIDVVTSSADVETAKPAPDIVEVALERAGQPATNAVFVGDSVWDVEAAGRAGVRCVGLLTGGISAAELRDAGALAVYEHAAHLLAELDASPLADVLR